MPFAILPALLVAFPPPPPETLRLKPKVGARLRFTMGFTVDLISDTKRAQVEMRMILTERTTAVRRDRITLVRGIRTDRAVGSGDDGAKLAEFYRTGVSGTHTIVIDRRARTVQLGQGPGATAASTIDVTLPEMPVAPGDSWTGFYGSNRELSLRYTLRGIRKVGSRRVALIDLGQAGESAAGVRLEPGSIFALDLADGRWLRATAGIAGKKGEIATRVRYEIARDGAPTWTTILAAFPRRGGSDHR